MHEITFLRIMNCCCRAFCLSWLRLKFRIRHWPAIAKKKSKREEQRSWSFYVANGSTGWTKRVFREDNGFPPSSIYEKVSKSQVHFFWAKMWTNFQNSGFCFVLISTLFFVFLFLSGLYRLRFRKKTAILTLWDFL